MNPEVTRHSSGGAWISTRSTIARLVSMVTGAWADRTTPGIQRIVPDASQTTGLPHRSSRDTFRSMRISFTFLSASRPYGRIRSPARNGGTERGEATISLSKAAHRSPSARRRTRPGAIFPCSFHWNARREPGGTSLSSGPPASHLYIPGPSIRTTGSGVPVFFRIFRPGSFPPGPCPHFPIPVCAGHQAPAAVFSLFPEGDKIASPYRHRSVAPRPTFRRADAFPETISLSIDARSRSFGAVPKCSKQRTCRILILKRDGRLAYAFRGIRIASVSLPSECGNPDLLLFV